MTTGGWLTTASLVLGASACCLTAVGPDAGNWPVDAGNGPAGCAAAGGVCGIGPPDGCPGIILSAYNCNPGLNPGGGFCCLIHADGGPPTRCMISGTMYALGAADPFVSCHACDPAQSPTDWSPISGSPCDGGACDQGVCRQG